MKNIIMQHMIKDEHFHGWKLYEMAIIGNWKTDYYDSIQELKEMNPRIYLREKNALIEDNAEHFRLGDNNNIIGLSDDEFLYELYQSKDEIITNYVEWVFELDHSRKCYTEALERFAQSME